jgi:hypothetical protein
MEPVAGLAEAVLATVEKGKRSKSWVPKRCDQKHAAPMLIGSS